MSFSSAMVSPPAAQRNRRSRLTPAAEENRRRLLEKRQRKAAAAQEQKRASEEQKRASEERERKRADLLAVRTTQPAWDDQRVYGFETTDTKGMANGRRMRRIVKQSVEAAKAERREAKRRVAEAVYTKRLNTQRVITGRAPVEEDEEKKHDPAYGPLMDMFDRHGYEDVEARKTQVTSKSLLAQLRAQIGEGDGNFEIEDRDQFQTHVVHVGEDGKRTHMLTLHRGATAFTPTAPHESGRMLARKHGSKKQYVYDDRGVPTPRFAYTIRDRDQMAMLDRGETLRGRHMYARPGPEGGVPRLRSVREATPSEQAEFLGSSGGDVRYDTPVRVPTDTMAFIHQFHGTGARQRGISVAATPRPLLSNQAAGFARPDDPQARKLTIDLAQIPPPQPVWDETPEPNLINLYHRIPGYAPIQTPPRHWVKGKAADGNVRSTGVAQSAKANAEYLDWSAGKNREIFLRTLHRSQVVSSTAPSPLERTHYTRAQLPGLLATLKPSQPRR